MTGRARAALAVGFGAGAAGGLIGLGGAELRLPWLSGLGRSAVVLIAINLAVSAATMGAALPVRLATADRGELAAHAGDAAFVALGSVAAAWVGAGWLRRIPSHALGRIMAALLLALGLGLAVEAAVGMESAGALPEAMTVRALAGVLSGLLIGAVSSLLGVAGGEVIIPVLVFAFGVPLKTAGTLSLLISIPTVAVGLVRHAVAGRYADREIRAGVIAPLSIGAVVGALTGAGLVGAVPIEPLKLALAALLVWSAWKVGRDLARAPSPTS